jgi:hypothetical protein
MRLSKDDRGQVYSMEGIVASMIILSVLLFIIQSNSIVVPQTERSIDMKLYEKAGDALTCLDRSDNDSWGSMAPLSMYVTGWDGNYIASGTGIRPDMAGLNSDLASMLPDYAQYNLELIYFDSAGNKQVKPVIVSGIPDDNSVVSTRFIPLNEGEASDYWKTAYSDFPHVVEVKLTCWYL